MAENEIELTTKHTEPASLPTHADSSKRKDHEETILTVNTDENNMEEADEAVDEENEQPHPCILRLVICRRKLSSSLASNKNALEFIFKTLLLIGIIVYLGFAFHHSFGDSGSLTLVGLCCFGVGYRLLSFCIRRYGRNFREIFLPHEKQSKSSRVWRQVYRWTLILLVGALFAYILVESSMKRPQNLVSLLGIVVFTCFMLTFSKHPDKVRWRPVIGGLMLQFVFGVLVLRTRWGYLTCQWLSDRVTDYLDHTNHGSKFVFGNSYTDHYFAFKVLPCIIVFSATISVLYYLGVMQVAIHCVTALIRVTLDSGPMETLHAAFNVFVGWAETLPVVQPMLADMTLSEIHAVMTNGFATVSGGTLAAYILYGAPANHLISASFMSAPAALAMAKLFYPEKSTKRRAIEAPKIQKTERGVIEAASAGAISAIPVIAYIIVHLIAFLSILDFVNATLAWLGARAGVAPPHHPVLSFQYISSYLLWPVALLMGVEVADCRTVARMLGVKVFVNEFLAFEDLGKVRANNEILQNYTSHGVNATWHWTPTDDIVLDSTGEVLIGGAVSERSTTIATYALCGFSDLVALGMMVGALSAVAPSRRQDFLRVAPRALLSGIMACFLTAAMAGLMVE